MNDSKVLLIEDDEAIANLYRLSLERGGFQVVVAADGKAGLAHALHEDYSVILLDIMLPQMNGFDILRVLGEKGRLAKTPVVVISNMTREELAEAKRLGARDFFIKAQITPDQLLDRVRKISHAQMTP